MAVPADGTGTASVETVKVPLVPGMQKPPRWVGKRYWDPKGTTWPGSPLWKEAQREVRQH